MSIQVQMIDVRVGNLRLVLDKGGDGPVRLLHLARLDLEPAKVPEDKSWAFRLVELRLAGEDHDYLEAGRFAGSGAGARLRYVEHREERTLLGCRLVIVQRDDVTGLQVTSTLVAEEGCVESRTAVRNGGAEPQTIEAVSSFFLAGLSKEGTSPRGLRAAIHTPRTGWYAEFQWSRATASELGFNSRYGFGSRHETVQSTGPWCSSNYLPMGYVENIDTGSGLAWEILHGGSWSWQIGETAGELYLHVAGPTEAQSHWWRTLLPGDSFEAVPAVVAPAASFEDAIAALGRHRRRTRLTPARPAPVVFNDYMNCLKGDPSEAAVLPLVRRAAQLGAEVYCVDAGWYGPPEQRWSYLLGSWEPDPQRFPRGLAPVMDEIRSEGMTPGLWFEIEAMTDTHPRFKQLPDDWFFMRHGRRVHSHRRYQLDFRNAEVRRFADKALDMAVGELGCGYLKMDYNFDSGPGSELGAENLGQSLLDYEKAFLEWLDAVRSRYPALMIEHCASGGMRLGRPYLDRANVASNSDEGDPLQIARIAVAGTTQILPEQNGTWAVPQPSDSLEETAFAMLCALPYRMFIAGGAAEAEGEQRALIEEAIALHKQVRDEIAESLPTWPLGLPGYHDSWICAGLITPARFFVALWRRDGGPEEISVPLPAGASGGELLYPSSFPTSWRVADGALTVTLGERTGRFFSFNLSGTAA